MNDVLFLIPPNTEVTGLYTSVRHAKAKGDPDKLTAGEAAKRLRKKGHAITAKEAVQAYRTLFGRDLEWHHSGFKPSTAGGGMGRTYFFRTAQLEALESRLHELPAKVKAGKEAKEKAAAREVQGMYFSWVKDYGGPYGKKRSYKVLGVYRGPAGGAPQNFAELSDEQYDRAQTAAGRAYYGWDAPTVQEFSQ